MLCAVSEEEIGADIEAIRPVSPALVSRVCTEEEKRYIGGDGRRFLQVWTAKEALAKRSGEGISLNMKQLQKSVPDHLHLHTLAVSWALPWVTLWVTA